MSNNVKRLGDRRQAIMKKNPQLKPDEGLKLFRMENNPSKETKLFH